MKCYLAIFLLISNIPNSYSQKPVIDTSVYNKWPTVGPIGISDDGQYVAYSIENIPFGSRTLIFQETNNNWKIEVPNGSNAFSTKICADSRYAIFTKTNDTLGIIKLGSSNILYIENVFRFGIPLNANSNWIAYQLNSSKSQLIIYNLVSKKKQLFNNVKNYKFSDNGEFLIINTIEKTKGNRAESINLVDLDRWIIQKIWNGPEVLNSIFDTVRQSLIFVTIDTLNNHKSIWHYKYGNNKLDVLVDGREWINEQLEVDNISNISNDGNIIYFTLKEKVNDPHPKATQDIVQVDIWSYLDTKLQSQQLKEVNNERNYLMAINLATHRIIQLEELNNEDCILRNNKYAIINKTNVVGSGEKYWNLAREYARFLVLLNNGKRLKIKPQGQISPEGKFIIYYDTLLKAYFSYEIATSVTRNITKNISTNWLQYFGSDLHKVKRGIAGWLNNDNAVLVYDQFDIWRLDPKGVDPPINLTMGYGAKNKIIFYLPEKLYPSKQTISDKHIIVTAFNLINKNNGFFKINIDKLHEPQLLTMGPYIYDITFNPYIPGGSNFSPIKAQGAEMYIVRRTSATESPNYYSTRDFKKFSKLSDVEPEKKYNWYTSELHKWTSLDGRTLQGILYKPENFDPQRKYPVIFHFYERKSDGLNAYLKPVPSNGAIDIPFYVSNDYLVFTPDIYYTIGNPMQGTYDAVISAAAYISKMPFVDTTRLGLQGFSYGGWQTNYLVTSSNIFAAAAEGSGPTDLISFYGTIVRNGESNQGFIERGQGRMGGTLYDKTDLYIKNSPIFNADKVSTPLLMMHNKKDNAVPFLQGVELFTALRRLGKKVWMLQYDEGGHGLSGKSARDFSIRMLQFFDHYLKNKPAPKWMTRGVPAKLKGIETGLEMDYSIKTPGPGLFGTIKATAAKANSTN